MTFAASVYLRAHLSTTESSGKGTQIVGHLFIKSLTCETALTEHSRKNKKIILIIIIYLKKEKKAGKHRDNSLPRHTELHAAPHITVGCLR